MAGAGGPGGSCWQVVGVGGGWQGDMSKRWGS